MSRTILHCGDTFVKGQSSSQSYVGAKLKDQTCDVITNITSLTWETRGELGCDKSGEKLWDICHSRGALLRSGRQHTSPRWGLPPVQPSFPSLAAPATQTVPRSGLWLWIEVVWLRGAETSPGPLCCCQGGWSLPSLSPPKWKINPLFDSCYTQTVSNIILHMWQSPLKQKASSGFRNSLTKWTSSSSSSGSSLMTMTGPGEVFLRRLAAGADGVSKLGFQDVLLWHISRVRKLENFDHGIVLRSQSHPWFFFSVCPLDIRRIA